MHAQKQDVLSVITIVSNLFALFYEKIYFKINGYHLIGINKGILI